MAVCEKRYVFDAAPPDGSTKPLRFDPRGKCPVFQLDKNVADAVLDHRRHEQFQMAQYIAESVATVPPRNGLDGGMNPVFADKLVPNNRANTIARDASCRLPASPGARRAAARAQSARSVCRAQTAEAEARGDTDSGCGP